MPVNMTPKRKPTAPEPPNTETALQNQASHDFGQETDLDREKAIADAESKNLWDQTEVIDMDTF